jgi:hypothetical protein
VTAYAGQVPDTLERADSWSSRGLCRHEDPEMFFEARHVDDAKAVCARCPVLTACQRDVMEFESGKSADWRDGVVAGLTAEERAELDPVARRKKTRREAEARTRVKKWWEATPAQVPQPEPEAVPTSPRPEPAKPEPEPERTAPKPKPKTAVRPKASPPAPKAVPEDAPGKAAVGKRRGGRPRAKCPSNGAYQRHVMLGEPIDDGCREAHARANLLSRYAGEERRVWLHWSKAKADDDIAEATGLSIRTVRRVRARLGLIANEPKGSTA